MFSGLDLKNAFKFSGVSAGTFKFYYHNMQKEWTNTSPLFAVLVFNPISANHQNEYLLL